MEALAAVSLAGNILQFLDFTSDVISKTRQIHTSISRTLKEHDDLDYLTTDLKGLSDRLRTSTEPVDSVLGELCSKCSNAAGELLEFLETLRVKEKRTPCQSLRKTLKTLWGKEKLKNLEQSLASFRQVLTLHITEQLGSSLSVRECWTSKLNNTLSDLSWTYRAFSTHNLSKIFDSATKDTTQRIFNVLQDNKGHLIVIINKQTKQLRQSHAQSEEILHHNLESAVITIAEQSNATRILTTEEHERSWTNVLNAIADAASDSDHALSREAASITVRVEEANEISRVQISESLDRNQEIMKQEIKGLQRGLSQLQLEIDGKIEELKEIRIKIDTTDRKALKKIGNSANAALMSLHELYRALQVFATMILDRLKRKVGWQMTGNVENPGPTSQTSFRHSIQHDDKTAFELGINISPEIRSSLPMYYDFYYQPLFGNLGCSKSASDVLQKTKMSKWINKSTLNPHHPHGLSSENHAFFDLAKNGNELVWTIATLVAGLNACLPQHEAMLVLSAAFSLCYDPRCVFPQDDLFSVVAEIPYRVGLFFEDRSATALCKPRYDLDCISGKRLKDDYLLMSQLAKICGLQEEISRKMDIGWQASSNRR